MLRKGLSQNLQMFSFIIHPLLLNLKNKDQFIWKKEQEEAFLEILNLLIRAYLGAPRL